jgi:ABC-2 type transport system permease protein
LSKSSRRRARAKVRKRVAQQQGVKVATATLALPRPTPPPATTAVVQAPPVREPTSVAGIVRGELTALFVSPIGWVVAALFVFLVSGFGFIGTVLAGQQATMAGAFDVINSFLVVLLIPLLTMRPIAAQRSRVRDWELVVGKWLGVFAVYLLLVATTSVYVVLFAIYVPDRGALDFGLIATTYIGLLFVGAASIAIGVLASSVTRNRVVAYVVSLVALVVIWYATFGVGLVAAPSLLPFFDYIAAYHRYQSFTLGLLSLRDAVYFASIAVASLFITTQVLGARRWR